jgi:dolichyl-phosphate-mannose-protein mannosyltransferase
MGPANDRQGGAAIQRARRAGLLRALAATIAVLSFQAAALDWGQPAPYDLSPDSLWPMASRGIVRAWPFGARPADKYPEGGHLVAGLVEEAAAAALLDARGAAAFAEVERSVRARQSAPGFQPALALLECGSDQSDLLAPVTRAGRISTLVLSGLLVLSAAAAAGALIGPRLAWSAALFTGLLPAVVHYGATLNVDVPALAWAAASFALVLIARRRGGAWRLFAAGAAAGLSVATKDPLAAFVPGIVLPLLLRAPPGTTRRGALARFAVGAAATFLLASGALVPSLFRAHLAFVFGQGSQPYRQFDLSPGGLAGLGRATADALLAAGSLVGIGGIVAAAAVAILKWRSRPMRSATLLVCAPAVAYFFLFLAPIGYVYPRFTLPIGFVGAVALALAVARAPGWPRKNLRMIAVVVLALATGADAVGVVRAKRNDPRAACVGELASRRSAGDEVWIVPETWFLAPAPPIAAPRRFVSLTELRGQLDAAGAKPRWLWLALLPESSFAQRDAAGSFAALAQGAAALGYSVAAAFPPPDDVPLVRAHDGLILPLAALLERKP